MSASDAGVVASYPLRTARIWTRAEVLWGALLALPALALYFITLSGGVGWWDSGELLACAKTLSVAHRPGFPLYVLCGRVTFGFLADPRWLANTASALAATAALVFLWRGLCLLAGGGALSKFWIAAGGLFVATSPLFWRQAIRTEVYAPAYACLGLAFLLAAAAQRAPDPRSAVRRFLSSVYLLALATCLHSALAAPLWIVVLSLFLWGDFRPSVSQWLWAAALLVAGLSVYAYVPVRATLAPYVWGEPDTWGGFVAYFTASDSYGVISQEAGGTLVRAGELADVLASQSHWLFVSLGLCGLAYGALVGKRFGRQPLVLFSAGLFVAATVVSYVIADNADLQAYLVPLLFALWWGWSRLDVGAAVEWRVPVHRHSLVYAVLLVALVPCLLLSGDAGRCAVKAASLDLSDRWGEALLSGARSGDLVVIQDANTEFLLRGLAHSQEQWPEVTLLNSAFADAPWYRARWQRQHAPGVAGTHELWMRQMADAWRQSGRRVLVDFGTPGWLPAELVPAGWLGEWRVMDSASKGLPEEVPRLQAEGGQDDPDWVRTVVWYYYRLGSYYRLRGYPVAAARAWDAGLEWAPGEEALREARAELALVPADTIPGNLEAGTVATP